MNANMGGWLVQVMATDAPALPSAMAQLIWLHLGWSVVLASLGANLVARWLPGRPGWLNGWQWGVALVLAMWTWVQGPYSPAYWLGLAFQAPSIATVLLCDALMRRRFFPTQTGLSIAEPPSHFLTALALAGLVAGWALLLDTLALLPVQLYAWGFSPAALCIVLIIGLTPWLVAGGCNPSDRSRLWVLPVAVCIFVVWRLPSGNVWDAVLDPWLWLLLHVYVARTLRRALRRYRARSR